MLLWRDSLQLLTLYLAFTPIFSGRKAKINLHMTPKLTVVIPISCLLPGSTNFRHGGRGGGGGVHVNMTKKNLWAERCMFLFFAFFLVLGLFYRSQMVNFKVKYHFSWFQGGPTFSRGGGVQLLIPYRNPNNLWFSGGGVRTHCPPLDPHLAAICDRLLHLCLFSCNFVVCFQSSPAIKFLELTAWLLPGLSNIFCNSSLLSSITQ